MSIDIVEFDFRDAATRAEFITDMRVTADEEGTEAAKEFGLVILVGEKFQELREQSGKSLANVFSAALDEVADEEELCSLAKEHLKDRFIKYAALGPDVNEALKVQKKQREQGATTASQDAEPTRPVEFPKPRKKTAAQARQDRKSVV